jgi:hypothetical protein
MTIKPEVLVAIHYGDECWNDGGDPDESEMWQTIRAELMAMDADVASLKDAWQKQVSHSSRLSQMVQDAEQELAETKSRAAAADALLREVLRLNYTGAPDLAYRITNYLQGSSDETL